MKKVLNLFIEKNKFQSFFTVFLLASSIILGIYNDSFDINIVHFVLPFLFLIAIVWICLIILNELKLVKISKKNHEPNKNLNNPYNKVFLFSELFLLILAGYRFSVAFGKVGVIVALFIITISAFFTIYTSVKHFWIENSMSYSLNSKIKIQISVLALLLFIYFFTWKNTFFLEFGTEEIGHYFEKANYTAMYLVKISNREKSGETVIPASIKVSRDFSEFNYESDPYDSEIYEIYENRFVKVNKVYFPDGRILQFKNCLIPVNDKHYDGCFDENGVEWFIELTMEKVY